MDSMPTPPPERGSSPEPWATPGLALNAVPQLDRSVSTASSVSSRSVGSRLSESGLPGKRRGYMRPEGTQFSDSAKNRESVMNLGTIAHLQYYFARTGLLDAATGRVAKTRKSGSRSPGGTEVGGDVAILSPVSPSLAAYDFGESIVESPRDETASMDWEIAEPMMLPPTVSTYKQNPVYVPPPPDMTVLRRELREALDEANKHLQELEKEFNRGDPAASGGSGPRSADAAGWHEIQGLNLLDVSTLAIRAAKNYYTAHEEPQRLYAIKAEREIRKELYEVLEVLKRLAIRNFANGVQPYEVTQIKQWIDDIGDLLDTEEEKEQLEHAERESWAWREGDWSGRERERELMFLRSFDNDATPLPDWMEPTESSHQTPFLLSLQNGLRLVHLHNSLVRKSRRHFGEIKQHHTDTAKPYRCADNLRYWVKAAELRWDIKLDVDVLGIVQGNELAVWRQFDAAVLAWCQGVREEITSEWLRQKNQPRAPTLHIRNPSIEASV